MITIFTIPKPFTDPHIRTIQRNAILSWKKLNAEIILMGDEPGTKETAKEFEVTWWPDIAKNEFGTPLLDSAFSIARQTAKNDTVMYANADIIFVSDLINTLPRLPEKNSLTIGRRTDLNITHEIDFLNPEWERALKMELAESGKPHSYAGIDYFIFNKNLFKNLPPFAVGRVGWDNWVVRESRKSNHYTIDATDSITAIHQNHNYTGNNTGSLRKTNPEAIKNSSYIKNKEYAFTIKDANWKLTAAGLQRNYLVYLPFLKRYMKRILGM